jgi:hypothetical protein
MIVDCAYYQDGLRQRENSVPLEETEALHGQGGFVWLGLFQPDAEELSRTRKLFGLHALAIEGRRSFIGGRRSRAMTKTYAWSSCVPCVTYGNNIWGSECLFGLLRRNGILQDQCADRDDRHHDPTRRFLAA